MRTRANEMRPIMDRATRLSLMAGCLAAGLQLTACSTVQGILTGKDTVAAADAAPGAKEPYPSLGSVPDRPVPEDTKEQRRELADSLVADRDKVQYSDQLLRGGNDIPAPPPPAPIAGAAPAPASATAHKEPSVVKSDEDDGPGFFGRLFGRSKKTASDQPEALPASPTTSVEVAPVGAPVAGSEGPTAH